MKKLQLYNSRKYFNISRLRKLMVSSIFVFSFLPTLATSVSVGFTKTSKISSLYNDSFDDSWGSHPVGFVGPFATGALWGAGVSFGGKIMDALGSVGTQIGQAVGLIKKKDFSEARYRLDQLWTKLSETEAFIVQYANEVRQQLSDPIARFEYLGRAAEWRIRLLDYRTQATDLEFQLANAMS